MSAVPDTSPISDFVFEEGGVTQQTGSKGCEGLRLVSPATSDRATESAVEDAHSQQAAAASLPQGGPRDVRLRHLVTRELSDAELSAAAHLGRTTEPVPWNEALGEILTTPTPATSVALCGPRDVMMPIAHVLDRITSQVTLSLGRDDELHCDLFIAALPWRLESMWDLPHLPARDSADPVAALPLVFSDDSVQVGPILSNAGPCQRCVQPALAQLAHPPAQDHLPALVAFAAGAVGLYVRALGHADARSAISLTFSATRPTVEHRVWTCTPECRIAA